eukprot:gene9296-biopygen15238
MTRNDIITLSACLDPQKPYCQIGRCGCCEDVSPTVLDCHDALVVRNNQWCGMPGNNNPLSNVGSIDSYREICPATCASQWGVGVSRCQAAPATGCPTAAPPCHDGVEGAGALDDVARGLSPTNLLNEEADAHFPYMTDLEVLHMRLASKPPPRLNRQCRVIGAVHFHWPPKRMRQGILPFARAAKAAPSAQDAEA